MRFFIQKTAGILGFLGISFLLAQPALALTSIADITPAPAAVATPVATPSPTPSPVAVAPVTPSASPVAEITATPAPTSDLPATGANPSYIMLAAALVLMVISIAQIKTAASRR